MKKLVKATALSLSLFMILPSFAGCNGKKEAGTTKDSANQSTAQTTGANTLPLVSKPTKVSIFQLNYQANQVKSYGDIAAHQEIEKKTGITFEWIHPANTSAAATEQFNLMVASNELPDIIYYNWGSTLSRYLDDKVIIKLNDLIDKNAPDLKKVFAKSPEVKKQLQLDDGTIAMFPQVDLDLSRNIYKGFQIREDWLNKLGLKAPTTIDEWYTVLKAFKEKDPNGNGKADEIPFSDEKGGGMKNFSSAWGLRETFAPDAKTGKIVYGPIEPGYKEFLATMAKWYKEGLIDKEYGTVDRKNIDSKVLSNIVGAYFGTNSSYMSSYLNLSKEKNPGFSIVGVPYPIGTAGKSFTTFDQTTRHVAGYGGAISTKAKDPVLLTKLCNYFYSPEGDTLLNWGIEGQSYTVENGKKKYTDAVMKSPDGKLPTEAIVKYTNNQNGWMRVYDMEANNGLLANNPKQYFDSIKVWEKADNSILMPLVTPTQEESQRLANIMSEVNTYYATMFDKFVMGAEPIEKFDEYVNTIKKMGIDEAIKINQAAYDRYKARK